jgi:hypothetical protein
MSPLRRRMIDDVQIRNLTPNTRRVYVAQIVRFACYFRRYFASRPNSSGQLRSGVSDPPDAGKASCGQFDHRRGLPAPVLLHWHAGLSMTASPARRGRRHAWSSVSKGKGRRDRYIMLPPKLLDVPISEADPILLARDLSAQPSREWLIPGRYLQPPAAPRGLRP